MTPGIYAKQFPELGTVVQLGIAGGQVISVSFPDSVPADAATDHDVFSKIEAFLDGDRLALTEVEIALTVPTDQRQVLEALQNVPADNTVSVSRLARLAGMEEDSEEARQTVREAVRSNPIPLLIPDHRVRGVDGPTPPAVAEALDRIETE